MRTSWWIAGFSALKSWEIPTSNCPFRMEGGGLQIPNEHDEWMDVILTIFQKNILQRNRGSHFWIPNHRVVSICIMIYYNKYIQILLRRYLYKWWICDMWINDVHWTFDDARVSTCMVWITKTWSCWLNHGTRIFQVLWPAGSTVQMGCVSLGWYLGERRLKDERISPWSSW